MRWGLDPREQEEGLGVLHKVISMWLFLMKKKNFMAMGENKGGAKDPQILRDTPGSPDLENPGWASDPHFFWHLPLPKMQTSEWKYFWSHI
jgi:hypothetical protein